MSFSLEIDHDRRIVRSTGRGVVSVPDLTKFAELRASLGVVHYHQLADISDAFISVSRWDALRVAIEWANDKPAVAASSRAAVVCRPDLESGRAWLVAALSRFSSNHLAIFHRVADAERFITTGVRSPADSVDSEPRARDPHMATPDSSPAYEVAAHAITSADDRQELRALVESIRTTYPGDAMAINLLEMIDRKLAD